MPHRKLPHHSTVVGLLVVRDPYDSPTSKEHSMSKSKNNHVVFSLSLPKAEIPFATLSTSLKKFAKMREHFETLGLQVGVVGFFKGGK
jgi:hypothetical protein